MVTMQTLFALLAALLPLSLLSDWIGRHSVNTTNEACAVERRRAIQWGRHCGEMYFWIDLPSWDWRRDICRNRESWHQRVLVWRERHGWLFWYRPETA